MPRTLPYIENITPDLSKRGLEKEGEKHYYLLFQSVVEQQNLQFDYLNFKKPIIFEIAKKRLLHSVNWKFPRIVAIVDSDLPVARGQEHFNYNKEGRFVDKQNRHYHGLEITLTNFNFDLQITDIANIIGAFSDHDIKIKYPGSQEEIGKLIRKVNPYT